jgi:hypothetical protein
MIKKILFCAEDYGSIKSLFPIFVYLSPKFNCRFFTNKDFFCEITKKKVKSTSQKEIIKRSKKFSPDIIFAGLGKKIDRPLLRFYGNRDEVKKIVAFDEWYYNYKEVTKFKNEYLKINTYLVNDKFCYNKAIREGLDKKKIFITGQFHLSNIFNNFKGKKKISNNILFLHEDIKKKKNFENLEYPGYSAKQVLKDLISIHAHLKLNSKIIVKLHPSAKENFDYFKKDSINKYIKFVYNDNEVIKYMLSSKIIIGMRSMAILESIVLKLPVISYQPNSSFERCSAVNLGLIKPLKKLIDLKRIISGEKKISTKSRKLSFIKKIQKINFDKIIYN